MSSGTLLQTSVCTRQNPIPPLEAFVSNCIGNLELKCLSIGAAGSVMISFTFVSAASSTWPHSYLLHFLRSPCHNTMACFRSGFWSLNRLTNPMRLLKMVMSFSAGRYQVRIHPCAFFANDISGKLYHRSKLAFFLGQSNPPLRTSLEYHSDT